MSRETVGRGDRSAAVTAGLAVDGHHSTLAPGRGAARPDR